jgi:iron complex transport system ATP-binding protein
VSGRERALDAHDQPNMTPDASYELLGARDVRVTINDVEILRNINLKIGVAERVAIVGANGAGKTSLLRALSGTLPVASGEVILCTEPISTLSRATIARSIAVVGADLALPFATRADELVASHLAARDVRTLSAGERQLIAIALGLAQETPILALDEPTVHLDLKHRVEIADLLVALADRARTVVAIFHELDMVRDLFPRVIVMKGGQIVGDGAPSEVLTAARVADAWGIPVERAARL